MNYYVATIVLAIISSSNLFAQNNYMDNALNYNKLIQNSTEEGAYKMIGTYRVIGTSFLFGNKNNGDMFSSDAKAYNIFLGYNTFNQQLEFYSSSNPDKPLIKEPGEVDSFIIKSNSSLGIQNDMKFIYGKHLGSSDKGYYMEIYKGEKYSLYKKYKSELGYVSTNYTQTELRQFDLLYDYYYSDESGGLNKLKTNVSSIIKEFKKVKDISPVFNLEDFSRDQHAALINAFEYLNKK
jgi:hypothetical protein